MKTQPNFSMSKFVSQKDLYAAKSQYFESLAAEQKKIIERLGVLAVKHCAMDHQDFKEITDILKDVEG